MEAKMIRNMKLYIAFLGASLKKMLEYRVSFIVGMFSQLVLQVVELIFMWVIFQNTNAIVGWDFKQLLLIYGVMILAVSVCAILTDAVYDVGKGMIKKGKMDMLLLRPVHPLISILGESYTANSFGYMLISIILIVAMLINLQIPITIWLGLKIIVYGIIRRYYYGWNFNHFWN